MYVYIYIYYSIVYYIILYYIIVYYIIYIYIFRYFLAGWSCYRTSQVIHRGFLVCFFGGIFPATIAAAEVPQVSMLNKWTACRMKIHIMNI